MCPLLHVKSISIIAESGLPIIHKDWGLDCDEVFLGAFCSAIITFASNSFQGRIITAIDMVDISLIFDKDEEGDLLYVIGIDPYINKDLAKKLLIIAKDEFESRCKPFIDMMRLQKPGAQFDKKKEFVDYLGDDFWKENDVKEILSDVNILVQKPDLQGLNTGQIKLLKIINNLPESENDEKMLMKLSGYKNYTIRRYLYVLRKKGLI